MSNIILKNVDAPKDADILSVDIYSDGKARCFSWTEKWVDVVVDDINPHTNADRIRSMTDEELAEFLRKNDPECEPIEWWLSWLQEEVPDV